MISQLSILIPVFNDCAADLVKVLQCQAAHIKGLEFEVVVVDDGSTDMYVVEKNKAIERIPNCRYVRECHKDCRSAMRNAMQKHARYDWRIMLDARVKVSDDEFIRRYIESAKDSECIVCGGVEVMASNDKDRGFSGSVDSVHSDNLARTLYNENLRYRYEKHEERNHSLLARLRNPYLSFRTTNILYHRSVLERVPYDERIKGYGYEDVMLGKNLQEAGIIVRHIHNPVAYTSFEGNALYLSKVEEALHTLRSFDKDLAGFSPLLGAESILGKLCLLPLVRAFHRMIASVEKRNLCSKCPSLFVLKLYKLGFLSTIK